MTKESLGKTFDKGEFASIMTLERDSKTYALKVINVETDCFSNDVAIHFGHKHPYIMPGNFLRGMIGTKGAKTVNYIGIEMPMGSTSLYNLCDQSFDKYPMINRLKHLYQVCKAINSLHRAGFLHLDIKGQNVIIVDNDAILSDFSISAYKGHAKSITTNVLKIGEVFRPPENNNFNIWSESSDVWSFGVMILEVLFFGFENLHFLNNVRNKGFKVINQTIRSQLSRKFQQLDCKDQAESLTDLIASIFVEPSSRPSMNDIENHTVFKCFKPQSVSIEIGDVDCKEPPRFSNSEEQLLINETKLLLKDFKKLPSQHVNKTGSTDITIETFFLACDILIQCSSEVFTANSNGDLREAIINIALELRSEPCYYYLVSTRKVPSTPMQIKLLHKFVNETRSLCRLQPFEANKSTYENYILKPNIYYNMMNRNPNTPLPKNINSTTTLGML